METKTRRFNLDRTRDALNADPEFQLVVRQWTARLYFGVGEESYMLVLDSGRVADFIRNPDKMMGCTAILSGTDDDWAAMLEPVPAPFYQDFMAAYFRHGFVLSGDLDTLFAYYAAVRRLLEVLRSVYTEGAQ